MTFLLTTDQGTRSISARPGDTILAALRRAGVTDLSAPCGGHGACGKCRVELETGERVLACQTKVLPGMKVRLQETRTAALETGACTLYPTDGGEGYALAFDLGTTTVVGHLLRRADGKRLATCSGANAQGAYGADVIARISACAQGHLEDQRDLITGQLRELGLALCKDAGVASGDLTLAAVAGNTVMLHLLAGLDPASIGAAPYTPLSLFGQSLGDLLGLGCPVWAAPCVAGYVGGDITAGLLAAGLHRESEPWLFLDVGTNGEMALGCGDRFVTCAAAAGPAFEGAEITQGMTAGPGAVCRVDWDGTGLVIETVDHQPPIGICGSGLVDALAVALDLGLVDETGRLEDPEDLPETLQSHVTEDGRFLLTPDGGIFLTQGDIRKLQLAKAAIAAGLKLLMQEEGRTPETVAGLVLAGGFGSHIRPESAGKIGLIPAGLWEKTKAVGNAAGEGAVSAALSEPARREMTALRNCCRYLELSTHPDFSQLFLDQIGFEDEE